VANWIAYDDIKYGPWDASKRRGMVLVYLYPDTPIFPDAPVYHPLPVMSEQVLYPSVQPCPFACILLLFVRLPAHIRHDAANGMTASFAHAAAGAVWRDGPPARGAVQCGDFSSH